MTIGGRGWVRNGVKSLRTRISGIHDQIQRSIKSPAWFESIQKAFKTKTERELQPSTDVLGGMIISAGDGFNSTNGCSSEKSANRRQGRMCPV